MRAEVEDFNLTASHKLPAISEETGKGHCPTETPGKQAVHDFQVRQINPYVCGSAEQDLSCQPLVCDHVKWPAHE